MFFPAISPHNPDLVMVACDMTGSYISKDGGQTWRMFNLGNPVIFFEFDPIDPRVIYAGNPQPLAQRGWRNHLEPGFPCSPCRKANHHAR